MESQRNLRDVIAGWQTKLLQLDRRNSLLYYRGQRSSVGILGTGPDELLDRLHKSRSGLKFPYVEPPRRRTAGVPPQTEKEDKEHVLPGDLETDIAPAPLQRHLLNLHRKDREWEEEQGVNVLYVVLGFLNWVDEDGESAKAPLLLISTDLERSSPRDPWRLKLEEDDPQVNETLRYQLATLGLDLPEYDHDAPPSVYLESVARGSSHKKGWAVEPALALATFPFAKMAMWEDLDEMRRNGTDHPVVLALANQTTLRPLRTSTDPGLPEERELQGGGLDDLLPVKEQFTVLPADHSQLRAIESTRRGGHLVIHGPPGTGKSQTIGNLIGTLLADGKRVLFVSEKTAALDVVKKRLEDCELGCFCLDLHSGRARKASVYQQIREALEARRSTTAAFPLENLEEQRERLNAVARALHEKRHPLGLSVFEVHGRFAQVRALRRVDFPLGRMESLSAGTLDGVQEAAARIARRKAEFEAHWTSPWRALRLTASSIELADEIRQAARRMQEAVARLREACGQESRLLGLPAPETPGDVSFAEKIAAHMAGCPGVPEVWLSRDALDRLERRASQLSSMQTDRQRLEEALEPFLGRELPACDFQELKNLLEVSFRDDQRLQGALGAEWRERLCPVPDSCVRDLDAALGSTRKLRESFSRLSSSLLGPASLDGLPQIRKVARQVREALDFPLVPESWMERDGFSLARRKLVEAREQLATLEAAERQLFDEFEEILLQQVSQEMLVRYRTDHQSPWWIFRKSYWADQRTLRGCLRRARKLSRDEALKTVQSALHVRSLREDWESRSEAYAAVLGAQFSGRSTDWDLIDQTATKVESWLQSWSWGAESARRCFSPRSRVDVGPLLLDLEITLADWERNDLASRGAEPDLDLSARQSALEAGSEVVGRLARDSRPLWPLLRRPVAGWGRLIELLSSAAQLRRILDQEAELAPALRKDFEGYYDGPDSDWRRTLTALQWTSHLLEMIGGRIPAGLAKQCRQPDPPERYAGQAERLRQAAGEFQSQAAVFSGMFDPRPVGWNGWEGPAFERFSSWLKGIEANADHASAWIEYRQAVQVLESRLAPGAVDALREATDDAGQVPALVLRRVYAAWLDHVNGQDARLRFQPRDHEALREEFRKLDRRFLEANRARVRERCFRQYPQDKGVAIEVGQLGTLHRQLSLKRKQMPVRRLIQQIPQLLQALKPCFLMSPIAVSQYLSRTALATDGLSFDVVIFDEASQIFPQDAVPAIARAKQVVVVGDQKQLPPTSFFRSDLEEGDEEEEVTDDLLEGVESILDVMVGMRGAGVQSEHLGLHYRSRHQDLIRYSNHHFYNDRLLIFPSPDKGSNHLGLRDVYLPDGRYDAGASRTNPLEAQTVVDHAFELLRSIPEDESVGIVTLSRSQADLIEELLSERRLKDASLESRFAEDLPERFFVKNLENVQGDERDHIILSICYGPTVGSGGVPNRFGPINQEGGGRRLNVAVTRAKRSLTLIRSLRPDQITSESEGARLLRRFLEFAQDPVRAFEQAIDVDPGAETESPFEEAVYRALTERGHRVSKQVGCFGYRIDLAIAAEDGSGYDLGIECDGAAYHRAPAARDRDWLRQSVLEGLGWTIHRVWSTDWIHNPEAQVQAIERALVSARARSRGIASRNVREAQRPGSNPKAVERPDSDDESERRLKGGERFRFTPYRLADLSSHWSPGSIADERLQKLRDLVVRVVETEGPVHLEVVIERIRRHYGSGRAGSQIQESIRHAATHAGRDGHICWRKPHSVVLPGPFLDLPHNPVRPEPRGPAADGTVRPIEHIWHGELEAGLLQIVEAAFGASREDAVTAVARALGYERIGPKIRPAISGAIERLLETGEVLETPAGLIRPDRRDQS